MAGGEHVASEGPQDQWQQEVELVSQEPRDSRRNLVRHTERNEGQHGDERSAADEEHPAHNAQSCESVDEAHLSKRDEQQAEATEWPDHCQGHGTAVAEQLRSRNGLGEHPAEPHTGERERKRKCPTIARVETRCFRWCGFASRASTRAGNQIVECATSATRTLSGT